MESEGNNSIINWEKWVLIVLATVGAVLFFIIIGDLLGIELSPNAQQQNYSNLIDTKEIARLSVTEFIYNGIAQSFNGKEEPDYNVMYKSTVKVSVDVNNINYSIDEENKVVTFVFEEFDIGRPVVDVSSISVIPHQSNLYMDEVIALCRNDAAEAACQSEKLISTAEDNLRSILEAWYSPVFEGYSFEYLFGSAEGGEEE